MTTTFNVTTRGGNVTIGNGAKTLIQMNSGNHQSSRRNDFTEKRVVKGPEQLVKDIPAGISQELQQLLSIGLSNWKKFSSEVFPDVTMDDIEQISANFPGQEAQAVFRKMCDRGIKLGQVVRALKNIKREDAIQILLKAGYPKEKVPQSPECEEFVPETVRPSREECVPGRVRPSMEEFLPETVRPSREEFIPERVRPSREECVPERARPSREEFVPETVRPSREEFLPERVRPSREECVPERARPSMEEFVPETVRPSREEFIPERVRPSREVCVPERARPSREEFVPETVRLRRVEPSLSVEASSDDKHQCHPSEELSVLTKDMPTPASKVTVPCEEMQITFSGKSDSETLTKDLEIDSCGVKLTEESFDKAGSDPGYLRLRRDEPVTCEPSGSCSEPEHSMALEGSPQTLLQRVAGLFSSPMCFFRKGKIYNDSDITSVVQLADDDKERKGL